MNAIAQTNGTKGSNTPARPPQHALKVLPNDRVRLTLYGQTSEVSFAAWLNMTRNAVAVWENGIGKPRTQRVEWALGLLKAAGVKDKDGFDALKLRLELLRSAPDDPRLIRCRQCQRVLSNPISKALGVGPECRKDK